MVVIGPKELPRALRTAGQWIGKIRRISGHFRSGVENMIREAELQEMEKKWREQNAAIMAAHPPAASAEAALVGEDPGTVPSAPPEPPVETSPVTDKPKRAAKPRQPRKKAG
ncbi:MAG: twin-arginine translocase subunit TatB [Novosphingobium sp.]